MKDSTSSEKVRAGEGGAEKEQCGWDHQPAQPSSKQSDLLVEHYKKKKKAIWRTVVFCSISSEEHYTLCMIFAGATLLSLPRRKKSQVSLVAFLRPAHASPLKWCSHQLVYPTSEKVVF